MSITTTLVDFRTDISCDTLQLPDAVGLRYYNDSRDKVIDRITQEKEDYFYSYVYLNTTIWQNEYTLPKRWDLAWDWITILDWVQKIKWVSWKIKSTDTEYTKLRPTTIENLDYDIESYNETQNPFYLVQDNSIFIYPAPKEETELKIYAIMYPKKLTLSDNDTLPDYITEVILCGVRQRYLESQTRVQEAQIAKADFERERNRVAIVLSWRIQEPVQRTTPNLSHLS